MHNFFDSPNLTIICPFLCNFVLQTKPVELLVKSYPDAAHVLNKHGRLPLHLATESHKSWDEEIRFIVDAAPTALQSRDPSTHMFPFMLAAVKMENELTYRRHFEYDPDQGQEVEFFLVPVIQEDVENANTRPELDSIYQLLRGEPAIVGCGISNNPYESYLIRQVSRLEDCVSKLQDELEGLKARLSAKEQEIDAARQQSETDTRNLKDRITCLEEQLQKRKRDNDS